MGAASDFDVAVIGGGPAGSVAAGFLAKGGLRVVLLERERFPRYHIGESLLSATIPILDALGVLPAIEAHGFIRKPGGTFVWGRHGEPWSFAFRDDPGGHPSAFHVVRSEFDHLLLRHAAGLGVDVREEHRVEAVDWDGCVDRVRARGPDGAVEITARFVVDASGQQALIGQRDGLREFNPFFKNLAIFGYFTGAERLTGAVENNILSAAFGEGWFWFIPLHDGTTSVGAVVDAQRYAGEAGGDVESLYRRLVEACPPVARRLERARLVSPVRVIRDYSYCSTRFYGPGYLLAGDSACFIDPVFSTGVHLACLSGYLAAEALCAVLLDQVSPDEALALFDGRYRDAFGRYLKFLYFFYDHHADPDSYFWRARKLLGSEVELDTRASFVRLISGGADLREVPGEGPRGSAPRKAGTGEVSRDSDPAGELGTRHDRMHDATRRGRFGLLPEADLFRVRPVRALIGARSRDAAPRRG